MSYGRNFEFRVPPHHGERSARHSTPTDAGPWPIGVPVRINRAADDDTFGNKPVEFAPDGTPPRKGESGLAIYEHAPAAYAGTDPFLTTYSDIDTIPQGKMVQVVYGDTIKVCLRNTSDRTFLNTREYTGRTVVAGLGATPTLAVGDYLEPHDDPSDTNGYWKETSTAANAWLVITKVDADRGEVEARMLF